MKRALADRIEDKLADMLDRVESLLKENQRQILALAHALETHRTLTGEDVEAVLERQEGPTVDGRPYGDPSFVRSLEEYHRAAAEAHKGHGRVLLELPEAPEPVVPDQVWERPLDTHPDGSDGSEPSHGEAGTFRKE
jgi:cell division protease FtsH